MNEDLSNASTGRSNHRSQWREPIISPASNDNYCATSGRNPQTGTAVARRGRDAEFLARAMGCAATHVLSWSNHHRRGALRRLYGLLASTAAGALHCAEIPI